MIQNPILKVLSTFQKHKVKALLMGGQACIIYGAAEFSRDSDFVILLESSNLNNLKSALKSLHAKQIFFPPLEIKYLQKGHACHFRCGIDEVKDFRIDIMAKLRGCAEFRDLWKRRKTINMEGGVKGNLIGLEDLVHCKKTQRDKDWLMLKRLVEMDIINYHEKPNAKKICWWFNECRTPDLLIDLYKRFHNILDKCAEKKQLILCVQKGDIAGINVLLSEEEMSEREADKVYWIPLLRELEKLRRGRDIYDKH